MVTFFSFSSLFVSITSNDIDLLVRLSLGLSVNHSYLSIIVPIFPFNFFFQGILVCVRSFIPSASESVSLLTSHSSTRPNAISQSVIPSVTHSFHLFVQSAISLFGRSVRLSVSRPGTQATRPFHHSYSQSVGRSAIQPFIHPPESLIPPLPPFFFSCRN